MKLITFAYPIEQGFIEGFRILSQEEYEYWRDNLVVVFGENPRGIRLVWGYDLLAVTFDDMEQYLRYLYVEDVSDADLNVLERLLGVTYSYGIFLDPVDALNNVEHVEEDDYDFNADIDWSIDYVELENYQEGVKLVHRENDL